MFLENLGELNRPKRIDDVRKSDHSFNYWLWTELHNLLLSDRTEQVGVGRPVIVNNCIPTQKRANRRGHVTPVYHGDRPGISPFDPERSTWSLLNRRPNDGAETAGLSLWEEECMSPLLVVVVVLDEARRLGRFG